jgi:sugar phosphate isomerase/epimerase
MTTVARRAFLTTLGAGLAAPAILRAQARSKRHRISFSTLGCPNWTWKHILEQADGMGYAGIEIRGVKGEMDLTKVPELQGSRLAETKKDLAALGLVVTDLGASAHMHDKDPGAREQQLDEGRRFIDLAHAMDVKYVRVFGDKIPEGEPKEEVLKRVEDGFRKLAEHAKPAGVTVLIESHGDFTHSRDLEEILTRVGSPNFALLWDAHHTFVAGHEQPADTYARVGKWMRHTHLKDSIPLPQAKTDEDRRYVLTGTGQVPVKEQVRVLATGGYPGFYSFEWEKGWHPEIEEPEVAFPQYAKVMSGWLDELGVKLV